MTPFSLIMIALIMLTLDYVWLTLNKSSYNKLVRSIQGSDLMVNAIPAGIAYALMFVGLVFIVIPMIRMSKDYSFVNIFKIAGTFGLCVYGIWNMTNMAIFNKYSVKVAVMDTMWGVFIYTLLAYVSIKYLIVKK